MADPRLNYKYYFSANSSNVLNKDAFEVLETAVESDNMDLLLFFKSQGKSLKGFYEDCFVLLHRAKTPRMFCFLLQDMPQHQLFLDYFATLFIFKKQYDLLLEIEKLGANVQCVGSDKCEWNTYVHDYQLWKTMQLLSF